MYGDPLKVSTYSFFVFFLLYCKILLFIFQVSLWFRIKNLQCRVYLVLTRNHAVCQKQYQHRAIKDKISKNKVGENRCLYLESESLFTKTQVLLQIRKV